MSPKRRILLVEDEPGLVMTIQDRLLASGFAVDAASDGKSAYERLEKESYALVVLDIMLPDTDGFEICKSMRRRGLSIPVLMLTARSAVQDRVLGLKLGADDYLCKPFSMAELVARIEALLRRAEGRPAEGQAAENAPAGEAGAARIDFGGLTLDLAARSLRDAGGVEIPLSATEFRLLAFFATHPGTVFSREDLLDAVWGYNNEVTSRTVDVHVAWLRQKLREGDPPRHIRTMRGAGYRFDL
jgi:DNA-binding response OmpR family regulator